MERNELVEEIIRRVTRKLAELDEPAAPAADSAKPGLLILTRQHGTDCHALLESAVLGEKYRVDCALLHDYKVDLDDYDTVVIGELSCGALDSIASGASGCEFIRLAVQAILRGKRVLVLAEGVELFQRRATAPAAYYKMMQDKLDFLEKCGVTVCAAGDAEQLLCEAPAKPAKPAAKPAAAAKCSAPDGVRIEKRVLTEQDVTEAQKNHASRILVGEKCIITALARDAAAARGIAIIKDND